MTTKMINTPRNHVLFVVVVTALMAVTVRHAHAINYERVLKGAEKALSTPEARAQQEEDMRQFVAFQVRFSPSDTLACHRQSLPYTMS